MYGGVVTTPLAHETWFLHDDNTYDWSFLTQTATLALLAVAVLLVIALRVVNHFWDGVDVPVVGNLAPWVSFAVRMHLAMSLLGLLSLGVFYSPAMDLEPNVIGFVLGAVMAITGISMATGFMVREAAWLIVASGVLAMIEFGFAPIFQRVDLLGLAGFLIIAGGGRWSADLERGNDHDLFDDESRLSPDGVRAMGIAILLLRVAAGVALIAVAGYEKLFNPQLALDFLIEYPDLQIASQLGIGMSDVQFVRFAGATEVLFGLLLISGALPQVIVLIAAVPFTATLWLFGVNELLGHLPIYGVMLVILIYGSHPQLRRTVYSFRPAAQTPT
jgi:hypothetical protein